MEVWIEFRRVLFRSAELCGSTAGRGMVVTEDTSDSSIMITSSLSIKLNSEGRAKLWLDANNGNVGIGTVSPQYKLHVEGEGYCSQGCSGGSSKTLKKDIAYLSSSDYEGVLKEIEKMNVAKFRWKEDSKDTGKHI